MIIAASQFKAKNIQSIADFENHVRWHMDKAAEKQADLIAFPEYFTIELLTMQPNGKSHDMSSPEKIRALFEHYSKEYTEYLKQFFTGLSAEYDMIISAGTHMVYHADDDKFYNSSFLFTPAGDAFEQSKIHLSYEMVYNKSMTTAGNELHVYEINGIKYGTAICYDNSFPEVARILRQQGAEIILAPSACLDEWGKERNVIFARARAAENFAYVINSQIVGGISFPTQVPYGFLFHGQSGIYSPIHCMIGSSSGILCQATNNAEEVIVSEIDVKPVRTLLTDSRTSCNLKDLRPEIYNKYLAKD